MATTAIPVVAFGSVASAARRHREGIGYCALTVV